MQLMLDPFHMGFVQTVVRGHKNCAAIPKHALMLLLDSLSNIIGFTDVQLWLVRIALIRSIEKIDTRIGQYRVLLSSISFLDLGPLISRENNTKPSPVHAIYFADSVWIAIRNKNSNRVTANHE